MLLINIMSNRRWRLRLSSLRLRGADRPFNGSPFTCYCGCRLAAVKSTALKTIYQTSHTNLDAAEFRPQKLAMARTLLPAGVPLTTDRAAIIAC
jgi:hypothetical protein